jgi:spore germination cell wall hydrolase CwlJ-like protein
MVDPADNIINLACNIYWEARGEPISSKVSVAILTVNRVENAHYEHSVHSVVWERQPGPQFSWTEDGKSDKVSENEQQA